MKEIIMYTDGACSGNPGCGGYGIVLMYKNVRKEISKGYRLTTNNRMELLGVIVGLEALKEPCSICLYSDSKYVIDSIVKGWVYSWEKNDWKRGKSGKASNIDLWERLLPLLEKHKVEFFWVKGHSNNIENERCDFLARDAILDSNLNADDGYEKIAEKI